MVHFEATYDRYRPHVIDRWREDGSPGSGLWVDLAPHLVDQALHPFGAPRAVTAEMAALRYGGRVDAWALVTLRYPDKRVVLHVSLLAIGAAPRHAVVFGPQHLEPIRAMLRFQPANMLAASVHL